MCKRKKGLHRRMGECPSLAVKEHAHVCLAGFDVINQRPAQNSPVIVLQRTGRAGGERVKHYFGNEAHDIEDRPLSSSGEW